jgi:tetratricopeptide (TPR) repeat protein
VGCLVKLEGEWEMVENPPLSAAVLDIPDSVHGTVLARMDRLPEAHKLTLKVASVIGRTFALDLLRDVHPTGLEMAALRTEIEAIGGRDFVRLEQPGEVPVYIFKHNTTQEVAYGTLLFAQRGALHRGVAEWHERVYGDAPLDELDLESRLAPYYPALVHHWRQAEDRGRERVYAGLAGEAAAKKYANESAARLFSRALELTPVEELEARYRLLLGREATLDILGGRADQAKDLAELADLAVRLQDVAYQATVNLRQAQYANFTGDRPTALEAVQRAAAQAAFAQDRGLQAQAQHYWGRLLRKQSDYARALEKLDEALRLAQECGDRLQEGHCYNDVGVIHRERNDYPQALEYFQLAQPIYRECGRRQGEISCLQMVGVIHHYEYGNYSIAQQFYEQALVLSKSIGFRVSQLNSLSNLGNNAFDLGDYAAAQAYHEDALAMAREIDSRDWQVSSLDTLSLVQWIMGEHDGAIQLARRALRIEEQTGDRWFQGYTLTHLGLAQADLGQFDQARRAFESALEIRRELGLAPQALDDLAGLARLALSEGDISRSVEYVGEILDGIADHGTDGTEFPVLIYLTCYRVLDDAGELERAGRVLGDGYQLLQTRADLIQDENLREGFLRNVPFNRELLAVWESMQ